MGKDFFPPHRHSGGFGGGQGGFSPIFGGGRRRRGLFRHVITFLAGWQFRHGRYTNHKNILSIR
jgi:hypothetical protein